MLRILLLLGCFLHLQIFANELLSKEAARIQYAYLKLKQVPSSLSLQEEFISAFPAHKKAFLRIFQPEEFDQLYDSSHDYIELLKRASVNYPREVLHKCIEIGKNLVWDADAVNDLQGSTTSIAIGHPGIFISEVRCLSQAEQRKLFQFLADVEDHSAYPEYELLTECLNETHAPELATMMQEAKRRRMRQKGH